MRTILVAIIAICLAASPAGMSRAFASVPAQPVQVTAVHAHPDGSSSHEHGSVLSDVEGAAVQAVNDDGDDCSRHGSDGKNCASKCCGFACHAFQPILSGTLGIMFGRATQRLTLQDEQVEGGLPFSIDRPPRSA